MALAGVGTDTLPGILDVEAEAIVRAFLFDGCSRITLGDRGLRLHSCLRVDESDWLIHK